MKNKQILSFCNSRDKAFHTAMLIGLLLFSAACSWSDPYSRPAPTPTKTPQTTSSTQTPAQTNSAHNTIIHNKVVQHALSQVGTPYRYGGNNPNGFDCSGLVQYSHFQSGITVPRTTKEQLNYFRQVSRSELREGDLAFFKTGRNQYHVAIMLNNTDFVHAPSSGKNVSISNFSNPYWKSRFLRAGRL